MILNLIEFLEKNRGANHEIMNVFKLVYVGLGPFIIPVVIYRRLKRYALRLIEGG
jgi:hypothetical protein